MNSLQVNDKISLTPYYKEDALSLVKYLNDLTVYENMLTIPYPYTMADAEWFITKMIDDQNKGNYEYKAVRFEGELIGGLGFKVAYGFTSHKDEIAYWLAAPYRNNGIMTESICSLCKDAFERRGLQRIEAITFEFNLISSKVLEKSGFKYEGIIRNAHQKNGKVFHGKMYSLIPQDMIKR